MNARSFARRLAPALLLPIVGCAGSYGDVDLLEARLRDQQDLVARYERMVDSSREELAIARQETDLLRTQLAQAGASPLLPEHADVLLRAEKLAFHPMMTGARNTDSAPGDDLFNVVLTPQSRDGETIRLIGELEIQALDLSRPEGEQQIGRWAYTPEQARELWHAGFLASGYQMDLAWDLPPQSSDILLHARLLTADGRQLDATQQVRVDLPVTPVAAVGPAPRIEPRRITASRPVRPLPAEPDFPARPLPDVVASVTTETALAPASLAPEVFPLETGSPDAAPFPRATQDLTTAALSPETTAPVTPEFPQDLTPAPTDFPEPRDTPAASVPPPLDVPAPIALPAVDPPVEIDAAPELPIIQPLNQSRPEPAAVPSPLPATTTPPGASIEIQPLSPPQRYRRGSPSQPSESTHAPPSVPSAPVLAPDSTSGPPGDVRQASPPSFPGIAPEESDTNPAPFPIDVTVSREPAPAPASAAPPAPSPAPHLTRDPEVTPTSVNWTDDSIPYLR